MLEYLNIALAIR